ncbi:MAG: exodeoxyribonuclease VII small subunit [Verrucomicrobiales bacterium]|jgi:exodeoxyribonuclease VII small subunit
MGKATKAKPDSAPEIPFEAAIEDLERIVGQMESDQLPLDQLIQSYERGNQLLKTCQSRIDEAEQRIERIASGVSSKEVELEDFDASEVPAAAEAASKPKPKTRKSAPAAARPDQDEEIRLF